MTFIVAFAQAMVNLLQEWITAVAKLLWDHLPIIGAGPMDISIVVGIALAITQTRIVLGMPGAHGDPVRRHAVGAPRHVQEPKMDPFEVDKSALDRHPPPHHATQMTAQWIVLGMPGAHGDPVRRHAVGAPRHVQEPTVHIMDKSALDRQPPPHHATLMTAQHSQLIALGVLGVHGHHVQGHVVGAHRAAQEPKIHNVMVEQNAQDPQMIPDHAIQIAANVHVLLGRATIGKMMAMKSAAMVEETATAEKEKATVTLTLTVRAL